MTKKERVEAFINELNQLTNKYDLEITAEGTSPLLRDLNDGSYIEFGMGFFGRNYQIYED